MKNILESIAFGFRETTRWHNMKYLFPIGFFITLIWVWIGHYFWSDLTTITDVILEWLPFSVMRSDGAWMLSTFIWFQLVLVTFALIYAFFGNYILGRVSKESYSSSSLVVIVSSALFWSAVWFLQGDYIHLKIVKLLTWLPFETIEKALGYLFAGYIIYNAIVITILFVISIFSEPLMRHVEARYYDEDEVMGTNKVKIVGLTIKDTMIFLLITIVCFPLFFIPVINVVVQIFLWTWMSRDTLAYSAASLVYDDVKSQNFKEHRKAIWFISFVSVLFNFIPILNMFTPFFGLASIFHYFKSVEEER